MDAALFNAPGHWYTSYPSLNHWTKDFGHKEYVEALSSFKDDALLYLHIPFCKKLCSYCICNIVISNDREKIQNFVDHLCKEIDLLRSFKPKVTDIHFGGGTPSHLDQRQFAQLCEKLNTLAPLHYMNEVAMEIDPRTVTKEDLKHYASLGVNRISFGVQDFDPRVQEAINRVQPYEMVAELMESRHLFKGVNFDLLYGLPLQTMETFKDTIEKTIELAPDRITLLKYCHAPDVRRHMRLINVTDLPRPEDLPVMFEYAAQRLSEHYIWIGVDHFVRPFDSLHEAAIRTLEQPHGRVRRTFNGYSAGAGDILGLGPTTTSGFGRTYAQAQYGLPEYYAAINKGEFPILRGYRMTDDDVKRREVIFALMTRGDATVDTEYFAHELAELAKMPQIGELYKNQVLCERYYYRNVAALFDNKDVAPEHRKIAQLSMTARAA